MSAETPPPNMALDADFADIRAAVRRICAGFPGAYWRECEAREEYPEAFVRALTEAGYLGALIPERYGGSGLPLRAAAVILEEIHGAGCNAGACHAQMYIMGTLLRHGSEAQKQRYLPKIASGELRLQAFGVTEPTTGSDTTKLKSAAI
jgi:acyl-CoA dehydrogenase